MQQLYGRAVVEERIKPRHLAELAEYVRHEYGPATGPGFVLAELANGTAPKARKGLWASVAKAAKALVPGNGNGRKAKAPQSVR